MPKDKTPIIELDSVTKKYSQYKSEVAALKKVSLKIYSGDFVSIVGTSGCGKSTLLHLMGLLDRPTEGRILIDGNNTTKITGKDIAAFRGKKLGFIFQNYNLIPRLTVLENVILPGLIKGNSVEKLNEKASELLKDVGIAHRIDHKGVHLSGGEQQRVSIARSLINDPVVVLADEPTGSLDTKHGNEIMRLLKKTNEEKEVAVVFVSHDPYIADYGKRVILLEDGEIIDKAYKLKLRKKTNLG